MAGFAELTDARGPGDRVYAAVKWTFAGVIAAIVIYGFVIARHVPTPRGVGFRLVILTMLAVNALWWAVADRRLARFVSTADWSRALRMALAAFFLGMNVPVGYMLAAGRTVVLADVPTVYAAALTLWHIGLVLLMPAVVVARFAVVTLAGMLRARARRVRARACEQVRAVDEGRRAVLKTAAAYVPLVLLGAGTATSKAQEGRFAVRRHSVAAPWLPERLRGLTITHITDLHVGRLYRPWMLGRLVEQANRLDSDIVVITGDIVDVSNDMLPAALDAIGQLRHRHGLFICIGNHDELDNRQVFVREVGRRHRLLINERQTLEIGGEKLTIAGVDFASSEKPVGRRPGDLANVAMTLAGYDGAREGPVIALAHHPHTWDVLASAGVPLTLSGHTHGGQIMFTPPGERPDVGIGRVLFRYTSGFYRRRCVPPPASGPSNELSTLFISSGVGNWFPLRINAPAEIVQLRLG